MSDLLKIARQRVDDSHRTHWEGCERDHRECLIQRMADEIERLREYADTLVRERNAAWAESAELRRRAELFDALQNMPVEEAQAYFWNYGSRKARATAIRDRTGRNDAAMKSRNDDDGATEEILAASPYAAPRDVSVFPRAKFVRG